MSKEQMKRAIRQRAKPRRLSVTSIKDRKKKGRTMGSESRIETRV